MRFSLLCTLSMVLVNKLLYFCRIHGHSFGTDEGLETVNFFSKFFINVQTSGFPRFSYNCAFAICFSNLHKISLSKLFSRW